MSLLGWLAVPGLVCVLALLFGFLVRAAGCDRSSCARAGGGCAGCRGGVAGTSTGTGDGPMDAKS